MVRDVGKTVTKAEATQTGGVGRRLGAVAFRLLLVVAVLAGWAGFELHAERAQAAAQLQDFAATAASGFDAFISRFTAVTGQFGGVAVAPHNRVDIAVRMLQLEPALTPAENLFLYNAAGQFIAATLPLLPDDANVSRHAWFEAAAAQVGEPLYAATADAPLGEGPGVIVSRTIGDPAGAPAGVIGTFLAWPVLRALVTPSGLPPGSTIRLVSAHGTAPMLTFTVGVATNHPLLDKALTWIGETPSISATAHLPGGLIWNVVGPAFTGLTPTQLHTVIWHGALAALGVVILLWLLRPRRRPAPQQATEAPPAPVPELEWGWEIDSRGRLVGVAGNAPEPLLAAIGTNFLSLLAKDERAEHLREAIAERTPVHDLELAIILPGSPRGTPRRFRVSGRFVADTGGFWGTAEEIAAMEPIKEAAD